MKKYLLIFALVALASCGGREQKKAAAGGSEQPTAQGEQSAGGGYVRVSGAAVGSFELRGGDALPKAALDAWFSRELLRALDDALTRYDYTVAIRNDSIAASGRDTISITIYDFRTAAANAEVAAKLNAVFSDSALVERFIGVLKLSYTAVYFMLGDDLCVVVRQGVTSSMEREMREDYPDYFPAAAPVPRPEELKRHVLHQSNITNP